mgnify:CR=1 FL=1
MPLQGSEKELQDYSLAELADRHLGGMPPPCAASPVAGAGAQVGAAAAAWAAVVVGGGSASVGATTPLTHMRQALEAAMRLGEALHARLVEVALPPESMEREMQVGCQRCQRQHVWVVAAQQGATWGESGGF